MVHRRTYLIAGALVVALAGGGVVWARSASQESTAAEPTPSATGSPVRVIVPGRPGESASVVPADELPAPDGVGFNPADVHFVRMMIPHHRQAVELAGLAPTRARNPQVKAIADRIVVAQGPEISVLRAWLAARGQGESPAAGGHADGHPDGQHGMVSAPSVAALAAAGGERFDRMFVDLMSAHHQGAIKMCTDVLAAGADERLRELATNIAAEQQIEIARMRELVDP